MRFRKDNQICYFQDFRYKWGIPSGIDFDLDPEAHLFLSPGDFVLRAPGYGVYGEYGDGPLIVSTKGKLKKRFEKYFNAEE